MNASPATDLSLPTRTPLRRLLRAFALDPLLLGLLLILAAGGLIVLYTAGDGATGLVARQAVRLFLGFGVLVAVAQVPVGYYRFVAPWFYALTIVLLALVFVVGERSLGAVRWIDFGVVRVQPGELAQLAVPLLLVWLLASTPEPPRGGRLLAALGLIALPAALIALEPDLGTALLVVGIGLVVLFLAGLSWRWIAAGFAALLASAPLAWHFMHAYQRERILVFLHPERDPLGAGYHIIQSQIAIGSGGLLGSGWMHGSQAYLNFLPEQTTDFIFAVFAEEFGLLGSLLLILLYLAIVFRILWLAQRASDRFSRLLGATMGALIFLYAFVNMAMVSGLLPVVGEPLPLVSFGGSSIVTLLAGCGAVMGLDARRSHLDHPL